MADFVAVIRKAVDNLQENTPENRAKVYDKARAAIRRQLEAINPRPSDETIQRQLAKLETAISDVDAEHAEALPPDADETEALMAELESMVSRSPAAAEPVPQPAALPLPPAPAPVPPMMPRSESVAPRDEVFAAAPVQASPFDSQPPVQTASRPPVLTGAAHDEAFGLGETQPVTPKAPPVRSKPAAPQKRGKSGVVVLVALLIAGVLGLAAWAGKDSLMAMLNTDPTPAPVAETKDAAPEPAQPAATEQPATDTAEAPAATGAEEDAKFTQRLNADGTETDEGPAPNLDEPTAVEGRSVASRDESQDDPAAEPASPEDEDTAEATTAETDVAPEEAVAAPSQPLGVQQKMYLYEERLDQQTPDVFVGGVVWTLVNEPNANGVEEPAIRAEINNAEKGLSALMTIRRNSDASLPASHIIEVVFALPDGFEGGGVDQLQRINLKETEQANGDPLIAVPAQITQDFYMVALNDLPEAFKFNTDMMRQRNWIDIPIVYANGRRGLITLEKGSSGVGVFNEALDAWARLSGSN